MDAAVSTRVAARNSIGQFIRDCEGAAQKAVEEIVERGARLSADFAPSRTGKLSSSIKPFMVSRTQGVWGSSLKYALPQETGAVPHDLPANVRFFWEKAGRYWMPPAVYLRVTGFPGNDPIKHPGNPGTHYLQRGYEAIQPMIPAILEKHYPG